MWEIVSETRFTDYYKPYTAFGIKNNDIKISDIFVEEGEAARFVEKINRLDVSVIHIYDVLEDYFGTV